LAALPALIILMAGLRFATQWNLPLPICWLRRLTGIPCPACGCTRCLVAWAHFDLATAFRLNPLCFLLCLALAGWTLMWALDRVAGTSWLRDWSERARRLPLGRLLGGLAVLNWLYLCLELPQ
jgi:uncharacterized protein DUF2752